MDMIGSPIWRILNYGLIPTVRYFFTHRLGIKNSTKNLETLGASDFAKLVGIHEPDPEATSRASVQTMMKSMSIRAEAELNGVKIKSVLESDSSISRLILLELITRSGHFKSFIETGTQHGLSAYIVGETAQRLGLDMKISSFDVSHAQYFVKSSGSDYFCLSWPARKRFMDSTLELNANPLVFFHDSDHSYENMLFEFNWAWDNLKADVIISDDIDGNDAFYDFCKSHQIKGFRVMIDSGPAVGLAMRVV
jgi:hypothetical protein